MEIIINNKTTSFKENTSLTVQQLLDIVRPEKQKGIAVAIQNTVVPKSEWHNRSLKHNDEILIISATQGG